MKYGTHAGGINKAGTVAGYFTDAAGTHGFTYAGNAYAILNAPGAKGTYAEGINDAGTVVGSYLDSQYVSHGFVYDHGAWTTVDAPGATAGTSLTGINDAGTVVGSYRDGTGPAHGLIYDSGTYTAVDAPNATGGTYLNGISNSGVGAGWYFDSSGARQGFLATSSAPAVAYTDTTAGASGSSPATAYSGPVSYLQWQCIWSGPDSVALSSSAANTFLHGGAGDDALSVSGGSNVLDGGTGSNFLSGASGSDGGTDTFFVDGRGGGVTWSTVVNFHHGDAITVWGFVGGTSTGVQSDTGQGAFSDDGAVGYQGATIHSELGGAGTGVNASLTIAGMAAADAASKLTLTTGSIGDSPYLQITYTG